MNTETEYLVLLMLTALDLQTGSPEAAWEALFKAHEHQIKTAPSEITEILDTLFHQTVIRKFRQPTMR